MNSREKGKRGERQWRDELRANGYSARRGQQFSGSAESPDVVCESLPWIHFEVKHTERLNIYEAMEQAVRDAQKQEGRGQRSEVSQMVGPEDRGQNHRETKALRTEKGFYTGGNGENGGQKTGARGQRSEGSHIGDGASVGGGRRTDDRGQKPEDGNTNPEAGCLRSGKVPVVAIRKNNRAWLVVIEAETFFEFLRGNLPPEIREKRTEVRGQPEAGKCCGDNGEVGIREQRTVKFQIQDLRFQNHKREQRKRRPGKVIANSKGDYRCKI